MALDHGSKNRLTPALKDRFPGVTLFDRIARAVCDAGVLPRKELYEAWEVARRAHRRFATSRSTRVARTPRANRVVELAAGHGLLAHIALLLDPALASALAVDVRRPKSADPIGRAMCAAWPALGGRVVYHEGPLEEVAIAATDLVLSVHACGGLTDLVLDRAVAAGAAVAVLPCCQARGDADARAYAGWLDVALAQDVARVARLARAGYAVHTQTIDAAITAKNRLLLATPP